MSHDARSDEPSVPPLVERRLTHVELVYRPGERELALDFFALLGCGPVDRGGEFFTSFIEPMSERDWSNNVLYASEVSSDQWQFEQVLTAAVTAGRDAYVQAVRRSPQHSSHFGFRVASEHALDDLVSRVLHASENHPRLASRVAVSGVYRPGDPGAIAPNMVQAFVWTDVVASGLMCLGQHIEVQWHFPAS